MIELRELTKDDGLDVYELVQELGPGQNGFVNSLYSESYLLFQKKLQQNVDMSNSINLAPQYVPQTIYWFYVNELPVGYGKLRHYLNDHLLKHGGHIGYVIRPTQRSRGYATLFLKKLLQQAKKQEISEVLLTCDETNISSRKVIEKNNGILTKVSSDSCFYWIKL